MRIELFELNFSRANAIYIAGQSVSGSVVIKLAKKTWINSIDIKFTGIARSKWDVPNGESSKHYQAQEIYMDSEYQLYKSRSQTDNIPEGMHVFPFDFELPADVPSSFEGRRGYVRYMCTVTLDRGWKGVLQMEQDLTVIRHLDLSTVQGASLPQYLEKEQTYEGCCCDSGCVYTHLWLEKSGFVPGEPLHYDILVNNKATSSICGVVLSLFQTVRYTGYSDSLFSSGNPKYHDKVNNWVLFETDDEIRAGKACRYVNYCTIPAVAPSLLEGCNIIDIMYEIQVSRSFRFITYFSIVPPSYEECVFGRMESQEREAENNVEENASQTGQDASATEATSSRRSRLRRLPSYPYYNSEHFAITSSGVDAAHQVINNYPHPPPLTADGYTSVPITEQPVSSLPPPPSYDSLHYRVSA
uniref:Arrestin C-terminal-like domain-containing protein n=1 Tax=Biomphalaria glabrata TaxID=6526 RepID=A0A2C9L2Q6_BIOGL